MLAEQSRSVKSGLPSVN